MEKNVGSFDRILRIAAGILAISAGLFYGSWWGLIGIVPLATGLMNTCPLYIPCGLSTCKVTPKSDQK
jgi:hypothetical protein